MKQKFPKWPEKPKDDKSMKKCKSCGQTTLNINAECDWCLFGDST